MRYSVLFDVQTRFEAVVEAKSPKLARQKAEKIFMDDCNIGDLDFVDCNIISVTDENGNEV